MKELNTLQTQDIHGGLITNPVDHLVNIISGCIIGGTIAKALAPESLWVCAAGAYLGGTTAEGLSAWTQNQVAQG